MKAGMRYYGSWKAAIEAAGIDYATVRLQRAPYTPEELLDLLRQLAVKRPTMTRSELYELSYHPSLVLHFGSIDAALERAGLGEWPMRLRESAMSREEVIKALRRRRRTGGATHWDAVQREDQHLWYSAMLHFGEWERAIEGAGLTSAAPQNSWTRESILDALRNRRKAGKSLKPVDMLRDDRELYYSTRTYFDRYLDAVYEVGGAPWELKKRTPELIIAELRERAAGRPRLTAREAGHTLASAAQSHFGSFSAACRSAGLASDAATRSAPTREPSARSRTR